LLAFFHDGLERPAEDVVDLALLAAEDLEGDLVCGQEAPERVFLAEEEQAQNPDAAHLPVGFHGAQGFGQFEVGQGQEGSVTAAALTDAAAEPL
jgi:hypothetical protein